MTQPDSIIPDPYNPLDWNRYSYVRSNPINNIDPTGHKACSSDGDTFDTCTDPLSIPASEIAKAFGITFDGTWSEENQGSVVASVALVSIRFGKFFGLSPIDAFKAVYGLNGDSQMKFGWGSCSDCKGAGGYTYGPRHIRFVSLWTWNPERRVANVIHELGHAYNNLWWIKSSSGSSYRLPEHMFSNAQTNNPGFPDRSSSGGNYGYAGPFGFWQQSTQITPSEEFADNFIGWVYNQWGDDKFGQMRGNWMNGNMSYTLSIIAVSMNLAGSQ